MKRISAILAVVLCAVCAAPAFAQTGYVTVSGSHLTDSTGTAITNATISFAPTSNAGAPIGYRVNGAGQAITSPVTAAVTTGAFTITLADTNLTAPQNVCFSVTVTDNASGNILLGGSGSGYSCVQPAYNTTSPNAWCSAGVCDFDNYYPPATPGVVQTAGPTGATGATGPAGAAGAPCTSSSSPCVAPYGVQSEGPITTPQLGTDLFVGATPSGCGTIAACVTAACAASPIARVVLPSGTQTIAAPVTVPAGCTLEMDGPSEGLAIINATSGFSGACTDSYEAMFCVQAGSSIALRHAVVDGLGYVQYGVQMQANAGSFTLDHARVQDATAFAVDLLDASSVSLDYFFIGNKAAYCTARPCGALNWYLQNESPTTVDIQNGTFDSSLETTYNFTTVGIFPDGSQTPVVTTATVTQGASTITVASASGIANGQWAAGSGIPMGPVTISGTTVTLPSNATVSGTTVPVSFWTPRASGTATIGAANLSSITITSTTGTPAVGSSLQGAGISPGTVATSVSGSAGTFTVGLSIPTNASTSASPVSFWHPIIQSMTVKNVTTKCPLIGTVESDCNVFGETKDSPQLVQFNSLTISDSKIFGIGQFVNWGSGSSFGFVLGNQISGALNFSESNNTVQNVSTAWYLESAPPTGKYTLAGGLVDDAESQSTTDGIGHYAQWNGVAMNGTITTSGGDISNAPSNVKVTGKNMQSFGGGGQGAGILMQTGARISATGVIINNFSIGVSDATCGGNKFSGTNWYFSMSGTGVAYENLATSAECPNGVAGNTWEDSTFDATGGGTSYPYDFAGSPAPTFSQNTIRWTTRTNLTQTDKLPASGVAVDDDSEGVMSVNGAPVMTQGGNLSTSGALISALSTNYNRYSNVLTTPTYWQTLNATVTSCTTSTCTGGSAPTSAPPDGSTFWEIATSGAGWLKNFGGTGGGTDLTNGNTYCTTVWYWAPAGTNTQIGSNYFFGNGASWIPVSSAWLQTGGTTTQTAYIGPQSGTTIYVGNNVQTAIGNCAYGLVTSATQITTPTNVNAIAGSSGYSNIATVANLPGFTLSTTGTTGAATLIGGVLNIPQYASSTAKPYTWGIYSSASTTGTGQISAEFTPTTTSGTPSITITRIQLEFSTAAVGCSTFPVISVYDVTSSAIVASVTVSTGHNLDSGAISAATTAGHVLDIDTTTAGVGCSTYASAIAGVVQYQ